MKNKIYKIVLITIILLITSISTIYATTNNTEVKLATNSKTNTVEDPVAKNNDLKSLKVEGYSIYPEFDKNITTYYCIIGNDVKSVDIEAIADNEEDATIKITGNASLTKNENTINIVVTSKSGSKKTYSITAKKQENTELRLESLSIEGATNEITINENEFKYNVEVEKRELSTLNITAKANNENASIEILGNNENLLEGDNTITIILKEGQDTVIYQLNTKIKILKETQVVEYVKDDNFITNLANDISEKVTKFFSDDKNTLIFLCSIVGILLILIIIISIRIIKRNRIEKNKKQIKKRAQ